MQEKRQLQVKLENLEQVLKVGRLHDDPSAGSNGVGWDGDGDYSPRGLENLSKTEDSWGHIDSVTGGRQCFLEAIPTVCSISEVAKHNSAPWR